MYVSGDVGGQGRLVGRDMSGYKWYVCILQGVPSELKNRVADD